MNVKRDDLRERRDQALSAGSQIGPLRWSRSHRHRLRRRRQPFWRPTNCCGPDLALPTPRSPCLDGVSRVAAGLPAPVTAVGH